MDDKEDDFGPTLPNLSHAQTVEEERQEALRKAGELPKGVPLEKKHHNAED